MNKKQKGGSCPSRTTPASNSHVAQTLASSICPNFKLTSTTYSQKPRKTTSTGGGRTKRKTKNNRFLKKYNKSKKIKTRKNQKNRKLRKKKYYRYYHF